MGQYKGSRTGSGDLPAAVRQLTVQVLTGVGLLYHAVQVLISSGELFQFFLLALAKPHAGSLQWAALCNGRHSACLHSSQEKPCIFIPVLNIYTDSKVKCFYVCTYIKIVNKLVFKPTLNLVTDEIQRQSS